MISIFTTLNFWRGDVFVLSGFLFVISPVILGLLYRVNDRANLVSWGSISGDF